MVCMNKVNIIRKIGTPIAGDYLIMKKNSRNKTAISQNNGKAERYYQKIRLFY